MLKFFLSSFFIFFSSLLAVGNDFNEPVRLYKQKKYIESIRLLKNIKNPQSYYLLAHNYMALKNWKRAIFYLQQVWKKEPSKRSLVVIELIKCYFNLRDYQTAAKVIRNAKLDFPKNQEIQILEINNLIYLGKNQTALKKIETLKSQNKITKKLLVLEGWVYTNKAEYEKSELSLKWALSLEPKSVDILNNLAFIYEKQSNIFLKNKKYKESYDSLVLAKENLETAIKLKPYPNMSIVKNNYTRILRKLANVSNKI